MSLCEPMECSPTGSSVHRVSQARVLEWVAISFSRGPSWPRDRTWVSCTAGRFFTVALRWAPVFKLLLVKPWHWILSKYKREPEAWNKHVVLYYESQTTSSPANTAHTFRLIPWLLELGSDSKESACSAGDPDSIPGLGRSPGERNGNPFQYPCLENLMDKGAWWAAVHGVAKSRTWLSDFTFVTLLVLTPACSPTDSILQFHFREFYVQNIDSKPSVGTDRSKENTCRLQTAMKCN